MRTRLKDVAERVKLSPALVSGVLNGKDNVWASEETRARVHVAARELNYRPSSAARALSHGRTHAVALVYRRLSGSAYRLAYTGLVDAFSEGLQARGHTLLVSTFASEEEVLDHLRHLAHARACDAVILWGREADTEPQGQLLDALGLPFLVKGRHEVRHPLWRQVDFDHEAMMAIALEHIVALGHRRVAYLGFAHDEPFVHALRDGFVAAHRQRLGAEPLFLASCEDGLDANVAAIDAWLAGPEPPTGFVTGAGVYAWHALEACLARRGRILGRSVDAVGIASDHLALTFGEAVAFQSVEVDSLATHASPRLLDGLLGGEAGALIVRFRPELVPVPTLALSLAPAAPPSRGHAFDAS